MIWQAAPVQVIILVSIGRREQSEERRQKFYEATARFALSHDAVQQLIDDCSYATLLCGLQS